jgi:ABC-2 type transport system ATP-binding protein
VTPLVCVRGLCKRYRAVIALDRVDLAVGAGEVWGLLGPNGAGKSTLLKILAGLQRADAGELFFDGVPISPLEPRARAQIGYAPERPSLYPRLTPRQSLALFGALRGLARDAGIERAVELGLGALLDRPLGELSRGQQQRAQLAVALLGSPRLLLLDEPHGGLDYALLDVLARVVGDQAARGGAVMMASHVLAEIAGSCSHVAVLVSGALRAEHRLAQGGDPGGDPRGEKSGEVERLERAYRQAAGADA